MQAGGVDAKGAHNLGMVGAGDANVDGFRADVGPGSMRIDDRQAFGRADLILLKRTRRRVGKKYQQTSWLEMMSGAVTRGR